MGGGVGRKKTNRKKSHPYGGGGGFRFHSADVWNSHKYFALGFSREAFQARAASGGCLLAVITDTKHRDIHDVAGTSSSFYLPFYAWKVGGQQRTTSLLLLWLVNRRGDVWRKFESNSRTSEIVSNIYPRVFEAVWISINYGRADGVSYDHTIF